MSFEFTDHELKRLANEEDVLIALLQDYEDAIGLYAVFDNNCSKMKKLEKRAEEIQKQINHVKYINSENFE